jgi:hypothetical protein
MPSQSIGAARLMGNPLGRTHWQRRLIFRRLAGGSKQALPLVNAQ